MKLLFIETTRQDNVNVNNVQLGNKEKEFLVSKETVVLRRWERSKQKFGFIKRVDKGNKEKGQQVYLKCFAVPCG